MHGAGWWLIELICLNLICPSIRVWQKRLQRHRRLKQLGGGEELVARGKAQSQQWYRSVTDMCTAAGGAHAHAQLPQLLPGLFDFLVSHEGLDFHSDVDEGEAPCTQQLDASMSMSVDREWEAAPAAAAVSASPEVPIHAYAHAGQKTVLTHSFRSPLAAALLHALDSSEQPLLSSRVGAALSVRMARTLQLRSDLALLLDQEQVGIVAQSSSKQMQQMQLDQDEVDDVLDMTEARVRVGAASIYMQPAGSSPGGRSGSGSARAHCTRRSAGQTQTWLSVALICTCVYACACLLSVCLLHSAAACDQSAAALGKKRLMISIGPTTGAAVMINVQPAQLPAPRVKSESQQMASTITTTAGSEAAAAVVIGTNVHQLQESAPAAAAGGAAHDHLPAQHSTKSVTVQTQAASSSSSTSAVHAVCMYSLPPFP